MKWFFRLAYILLASTACYGGEPLTFVTLDGVAPFSYVENGEIKGYDYDIFMEVMKRADIPVNMITLPFNRALAYLQEGQVDGIAIIYYKKDREKFIRYCPTPVHVATFHLFVAKGREFPFQSIEDLYGKSVGNQLGFTVSPEFSKAVSDKKIFLDEALSIEMNLKKLLAGRVDCYISSIRLIRPISRSMGIADQIAVLPNPILPRREILMAVSLKSKNIEDIDAFITTFSRIRKQLDEDGTITRFDNRYFPAKAEKQN